MAHPTIRQLAAGPPSQTDGLSVELHALWCVRFGAAQTESTMLQRRGGE